jgi:hypothetical protein
VSAADLVPTPAVRKRRGELPPEDIEGVCRLAEETIMAGGDLKAVAFALGKPLPGLWLWLRMGRDALKEPYLTLWSRICQAMVRSDKKLFGIIRKHGEKDWRAAAWLVDRRYKGSNPKLVPKEQWSKHAELTLRQHEAETQVAEAKAAVAQSLQARGALLELLTYEKERARASDEQVSPDPRVVNFSTQSGGSGKQNDGSEGVQIIDTQAEEVPESEGSAGGRPPGDEAG